MDDEDDPFPPLEAFGLEHRRITVLRFCLSQDAVTVTEVAAEFDLSINAARRHLVALERAGVVALKSRDDERGRRIDSWSAQPNAVMAAIDDLDLFLFSSLPLGLRQG